MKKLIIIYGANSSGKTTFAQKFNSLVTVVHTDELYSKGVYNLGKTEVLLSDSQKIQFIKELLLQTDTVIMEGKRFFNKRLLDVCCSLADVINVSLFIVTYNPEVLEEKFLNSGKVVTEYLSNPEVAEYESREYFNSLYHQNLSNLFIGCSLVNVTDFTNWSNIEESIGVLEQSQVCDTYSILQRVLEKGEKGKFDEIVAEFKLEFQKPIVDSFAQSKEKKKKVDTNEANKVINTKIERDTPLVIFERGLKLVSGKTPWDVFASFCKIIYEAPGNELRNVFFQIDDTTQKYCLDFPWKSVASGIFWHLRETSDIVEGAMTNGGGWMIRYDPSRAIYLKGNGVNDWTYKDHSGGRMNHSGEYLLDVYPKDDLVYPQVTGRVDGEGQLHYVKDLLMHDKSTAMAIVHFWNWKRDLVEFARRKWEIYKDGKWSDSLYQRLPCAINWHFNVDKHGVNNSASSRSMITFAENYVDDVFRWAEVCNWLGGHIKKRAGGMQITIGVTKEIFYGKTTKQRFAERINSREEKGSIIHSYPCMQFPIFSSAEEFEKEWKTKELAEHCYRIGAFEDGDKLKEQLTTEYFKEWVNSMRIADVMLNQRALSQILQVEHKLDHLPILKNRAMNKSWNYMKDFDLVQEVDNLKSCNKPAVASEVINYLIRTDSSDKYMEVVELFPKEWRDELLMSAFSCMKTAYKVDKNRIMQVFNHNIQNKRIILQTPFAEDVEKGRFTVVDIDVRKPIILEREDKDKVDAGDVYKDKKILDEEIANLRKVLKSGDCEDKEIVEQQIVELRKKRRILRKSIKKLEDEVL